jgi:murein L,D-transpeptidase YcbB/YkuD
MKSIVFSPYWNIPKSILDKEILPVEKTNYLEHDMEWHGDYVRQKPGPKNSLGLIKFLFPNSNAIYLHLLQRVYSIEKIEPSVTVVLEWKSPLNWQLRF